MVDGEGEGWGEAPRCPGCGGRRWVSEKPGRPPKGGHPQEVPGAAAKVAACAGWSAATMIPATALACVADAFINGLAAFAAIGVGTLACLAGIVFIDGGLDGRACQIRCSDCGKSWKAPWR